MARIRHIAIVTKDVQRLVKFYTTVFGLQVALGRGTGTYLSDGHVNLAILPLDPERETEGPYLKEGFYHFGFQVDDVDALRPVCEAAGATSKVAARPANREAEFRVYDPDGNGVDLSQHGWPL
jgi:catechol 2,3-dioxygenase-like lactoylglutathione lyase family enzyme